MIDDTWFSFGVIGYEFSKKLLNYFIFIIILYKFFGIYLYHDFYIYIVMIKGAFNWKDDKTSILILCIILPLLFIISTTPLHEMGHWLMSDMDPYVEPVEMHLFTSLEYNPIHRVLFSNLGSIVIQEKYPGAFQDRPNTWNIFQELVCISYQMIITIALSIKIMSYITTKKIVPNEVA